MCKHWAKQLNDPESHIMIWTYTANGPSQCASTDPSNWNDPESLVIIWTYTANRPSRCVCSRCAPSQVTEWSGQRTTWWCEDTRRMCSEQSKKNEERSPEDWPSIGVASSCPREKRLMTAALQASCRCQKAKITEGNALTMHNTTRNKILKQEYEEGEEQEDRQRIRLQCSCSSYPPPLLSLFRFW